MAKTVRKATPAPAASDEAAAPPAADNGLSAEEQKARDVGGGCDLPGCKDYMVVVTTESAPSGYKTAIKIVDCPDTAEAKRRFIIAKGIPLDRTSEYAYDVKVNE